MNEERAFTTAELSARWRVNQAKILEFINSGELVALNLALDRNGKKRRFKVLSSEVERFEESRSTKSPVKTTRRRRRKTETVTKDFFPNV